MVLSGDEVQSNGSWDEGPEDVDKGRGLARRLPDELGELERVDAGPSTLSRGLDALCNPVTIVVVCW